MPFTWIKPTRSHSGAVGTGARIAIYKSNNRPHLSISIYEDTMKRMRWQTGDRVEIGFDLEEMKIGLCRVTEGGYALTPLTSPKKGDKRKTGQTISAIAKVVAPDELQKILTSKVNVSPSSISEDAGVLVLPFGENT